MGPLVLGSWYGRSRLVVALWTASALLSPVAGWAEELEIPAQFADAPAIVLEKSQTWEVRPYKTSTVNFRHRVLIRTRAGLDHADQSIHYGTGRGQLEKFKARTLLPDGAEIPVPDDLQHEVITGMQGDQEYRMLQFTFPGAVPGAILEWEYTLKDTEGFPFQLWSVRETIPVLLSRFQAQKRHVKGFQPSKLIWLSRGKPHPNCHIATHSADTLDLSCTDIPAIEFEPFAPPAADLAVDFQITLQFSNSLALPVEWRNRNAAVRWKEIEKFTKKRAQVARMARELIGPDMPEGKRINILDEYVKTNLQVREDYSFNDTDVRKGRAANVDDVLANGGGTAEEIVMLSLALLQEAGISTRPILAHDRTDGRFAYNLLGGAEHLMLQVVINGQIGYLDPACASCAPGMPHWRYCDIEPNAVVLSSGGGRPATIGTVSAENNAEIATERFVIDAQGNTKVEGHVLWTGQQDMLLREQLGPMTDAARRDWFIDRISGVIADLDLQMSDPEAFFDELAADYVYERNDVTTAPGGRLLLQPTGSFTDSIPVPLQEERHNPIWVPFGYSMRKEIVFELPEGFGLTTDLPDNQDVRGPGMRFQSQWEAPAEAGEVRWVGLLQVGAAGIAPNRYREAVEFAARVSKVFRTGVVIGPLETTEVGR